MKTREEVKETEFHCVEDEEETEGNEKGEINLNRRKRRQEA